MTEPGASAKTQQHSSIVEFGWRRGNFGRPRCLPSVRRGSTKEEGAASGEGQTAPPRLSATTPTLLWLEVSKTDHQ